MEVLRNIRYVIAIEIQLLINCAAANQNGNPFHCNDSRCQFLLVTDDELVMVEVSVLLCKGAERGRQSGCEGRGGHKPLV